MNPSLRLPAATAALAAAALLGSYASLTAQEASPATTPATTPSATVAPAASVVPLATVAPTPTPTPVDPAVRAAAEALVVAMHTEQVIVNSGKQMQTSIDTIADRMSKQPNITPELTGEVQKMREDLHALISQKLGWEAMKDDVVGMYTQDFSEAELKEITAFYRTPVGDKLVQKQPELSDRLSKVMRQRSMAVVQTVQQKIRTLSIKLRPAPPAVPMASPGASAVTPAVPILPHAVAPLAPGATTTPAAVATPAASPVTSAPVAAPTPTP